MRSCGQCEEGWGGTRMECLGLDGGGVEGGLGGGGVYAAVGTGYGWVVCCRQYSLVGGICAGMDMAMALGCRMGVASGSQAGRSVCWSAFIVLSCGKLLLVDAFYFRLFFGWMMEVLWLIFDQWGEWGVGGGCGAGLGMEGGRWWGGRRVDGWDEGGRLWVGKCGK